MNRVGERDPAERSGKAGRVDQVDDLLAASGKIGLHWAVDLRS